MRKSLPPLIALAVILQAFTSAAEDGVPDSDEKSDSNSVVQAALQAEVDGDTLRREALLAHALERDPRHLAARWHSGHVRIDDRWLTVEQAEQGAVAAYRQLRDRHAGNLAGEVSLARWCRKKGLRD